MKARLFSRTLLLRLLSACIIACALTDLHALDPHRSMSQYIHRYWNSVAEFSGGSVNAIEQTPDGYLWVGTDHGLIRFDGFTFQAVQLPLAAPSSKSPILGLATDAEGGLWIQRQGASVLRYAGGRFEVITAGSSPVASQVVGMTKDGKGGVLISDIASGILLFRGKNSQRLVTSDAMPGTVTSIAETTGGRIWLGALLEGLFSRSDGRTTPAAGLPDRKVNCLLSVNGNELWIGTDKALYRWDGKDFHRTPLPTALGEVQVLSLLSDRNANLWVGTARGLLRINANGSAFSDESDVRGNGGINALFEDREGNLWVGGARGLKRIRDGVFITYSSTTSPVLENVGPIYADAIGRTWFAPAEGGLYFLQDGRIREADAADIGNDVVYSIAGRGTELWIGRQRGGLTRVWFENGNARSETYSEHNGLVQNSVYTVFQSHDGTIWAGTLSGGVSEFQKGRFRNYSVADGLASNTVLALLQTRDERMWFGTSNGLSSFSKGEWKTYTKQDGLPADRVNCLLEDSTGILWAGTSEGLAFLRSEKFQTSATALLNEPVFGLAQDEGGWLWITTPNHVLKVPRDKVVEGTVDVGGIREYDSSDGLPSSEGVNRSQSVVTSSPGKIWLSLNRGLSFVDASHLATPSAPAIARIEAVSADGHAIEGADPIRIPAADKRITFLYTGLSLAAPEKIRFRYRVDGFDHTWSEAETQRSAVYTNLGPGSYRFRLVASNSQGIWNGSEAVMPFEVQPALWQAWWFRLTFLFFTAFLAILAYRFRLRHLTSELNLRFEERLVERTRIAQELHDTLLQGFLSAWLQLQVADEHTADTSPAKPLVNRVLKLMKDVIDDSRNAVRGLRSTSGTIGELNEALSRVPEQIGVAKGVDFKVVVEGHPRPLRPLIRDDVYRMGREALVNAFRHSGANSIQLELGYGSKELRMLVRDDGRGIDKEVLRLGRDGHFGLSGMRERAERIGGRLRVWSQSARGTEVELSIPGPIAFESEAGTRKSSWLAKLFPRAKSSED